MNSAFFSPKKSKIVLLNGKNRKNSGKMEIPVVEWFHSFPNVSKKEKGS